MVGGAASQLAGGKFANGAFTAAFNYLLNDSNPSHQNNDDDIAGDIKRDFGKGAWAAKKTGEAASVTGDVIEAGATEVAIGKGVVVAGAVASKAGFFTRIKNLLGLGEKAAERIVLSESRTGKIFGAREGHMADTSANRKLLSDLANNPAAQLGTDKFGLSWSAQSLPDGTQAWVQIRNGQIWNGGINKTPQVFNSETGLASSTRPGWK